MTIGSILLAAGRGRRLRPFSDTTPKPALPMLDLPLGAFGLARLREAGPVVVNLSHRSERVIEALRPFGAFDVLDEGAEPYGSAGTVAALLPQLADAFVTHNSDVLIDLEPSRLLELHRHVGAAGTIVVQRTERFADVLVKKDRVARFVDRRREPDVAGFRFLGVAAFDPDAVARLDIGRPAGLGESILAPLAERGGLHVHVHESYWADVGTFDSYLAASLDLLDGKTPDPPGKFPGEIRTVVGGRAYVGPGAAVAEDALGPGAIVLQDATVEAGVTVERSIVTPGARVTADLNGVVHPFATHLKALADGPRASS